MGTGESHTVRDFVQAAFNEIKIELEWIGSGLNEVGLSNGETMVKVSKKFYRPLVSDNYKADYSKAKKKLKWEPKTKFREILYINVYTALWKDHLYVLDQFVIISQSFCTDCFNDWTADLIKA